MLHVHPEVNHTEHGHEILEVFLDVVGVGRDWTPGFMIEGVVGRRQALRMSSQPSAGGSTVATALVDCAVGDQLTCLYVDTCLMRAGESEAVITTFKENFYVRFEAVHAVDDVMKALTGVTDPEVKRRIGGENCFRVLECEVDRLRDNPKFLVQGTIYPDVVENSGPGREQAMKIKTHHNVGGLPEYLHFDLIEPL